MSLAQLRTKVQTTVHEKCEQLNAVTSSVKEACTAILTGKFVGEEVLDGLSPRSSLPSIASSSDSSFRCNPVEKGPNDRLFRIQPLGRPFIQDYKKELKQFVRAEHLLEQQKWFEAAQMYAVALKKIPKRGHRAARNICMEQRAFCFSNIEAERVCKELEQVRGQQGTRNATEKYILMCLLFISNTTPLFSSPLFLLLTHASRPLLFRNRNKTLLST